MSAAVTSGHPLLLKSPASCPKLFEEEEWDEDRIDIIGSNGNDGDHYNE